MRSLRRSRWTSTVVLALAGCHTLKPDHPQLLPGARWFDTTIHSTVLGHDMPLRLMVPTKVSAGATLPVVVLLHGAGADYRDWSNKTSVAALAAAGMVLAMAESPGGFYLNEAGAHRHYEDHLLREVLPEIHRLVPYSATDRPHLALVGISRGGFGATVIGLQHPELFGFIGALSPAMDLAVRPFLWREFGESWGTQQALGRRGSPTRLANDPFALARAADARSLPFIYITCGTDDDLLETSRQFAALLKDRGMPSGFHTVPGRHDWPVWNAQLPALQVALLAHFARASTESATR